MTANPFNVAYLPYMGQDAPNPRNTFYRRRAPTNSDRRLYRVGDRWIDTASQIAYILVGKTATTANWVQMSGAGGVTSLNGLIGALSIIDENALGAITVYVPGSGGPTTIGLEVNVDGVTIQRIGDQLVATAAGSFTVDAFTAPGTNPVVPLAGNINVLGAAVAAVGIPVQTDSLAANSFTVEVQRASAQAVSAPADAGLSSFDSAQFAVDANGFVTNVNGLPASSFGVQAFTAPGTSPVLPTAGGLLTINGTIVAAHAIPIQTDSLAANTLDVEVQYASAQAISSGADAGMASFDSADFTVDANGFVSALTTVFVWQDLAPGALSISNGYFATGAGAYTLPAGTTDGETIEIIDNIGGGVVVTAAGGQTVRIQNTVSSVGGTATSTQFGDALRLIYRATNTEWQCCPGAGGVWILA